MHIVKLVTRSFSHLIMNSLYLIT